MKKQITAYRYVKGSSSRWETVEVQADSKKSQWKRLLSPVLMTLGSVLIANVLWPIISYQLFEAPKLAKTEFIAPISKSQLDAVRYGVMESKEIAANQAPQAMAAPEVLGAEVDYTDARNWFPVAPSSFEDEKKETIYSIDIPSLDIERAKVVIGGDDLDSSLVHYPGTAKPGQLGSPVVFGHSVLPQFYNPSVNNPNRYNSIFTTIMEMEIGEQIFIHYDGITYTYEVTDKLEVKPEDIFILEQRYNNRELKLITCTPAGTYLRRGVIIAQLVDLE